MSKINISWGWLIGIAICGSSIWSTNCAFAEIIPDGTLPNNSSVKLQGNNSIIEGGTQAGGNLFHSFREFSVPTNGAALFNNAADIQNIISRVTGGSVSKIDGIIGANGTANLFLINPNGIIFGADASLNVGGSFVASTANALQFGNIGFFSATDQNIPSPLLTINPSALLFNQINQNAAIQNNSVAFAGTDPAGFNAFGLRVPDGKSLLLVGGNVSMDEGQLNAFGGRVELGGLGEPGSVALGVDGDNLSLKFPSNVARTSVSFTNQAAIYVEGAGGGNIAVNASNLEILGGSILSGGIGRRLGTFETVAGDITLNATGSIKVADGSRVRNLVRLGSLGNGGNITIDSGEFSLQNGARLSALTYGQGNAGNVTVRAGDAVSLANNAGIFSTVEAGGAGKGGNITIDSDSFSLQDGAQLAASTFGQGNAGNVTVRAGDAVSLANNAGIFSTVEAGGVGKGGNIDILAATLSLIDGAQLLTATRRASTTQPAGRGDAGNVNVNVIGIVDIAGKKNGFSSGIRSNVGTGAVSNGGNITIDSGSFWLQDGAQLIATTDGKGNAGNVNVNVSGIVDIAGRNSKINSSVGMETVGNGGNINIDSGSFSLRDRAQLDASTSGQGNAGNVTVSAKDAVSLADNAYIFSRVSAGGVGKGGDIDINAATLSLIDGAQLIAATDGKGNAGNVTLRAQDAVSLADNAYIFSKVELGGVGKGGDININAATLSLSDGAQLNATTDGKGNGGSVIIDARKSVYFDGVRDGIFPSAAFGGVGGGGKGNGGGIYITTDELSLTNGAQLQASTGGIGDSGNVIINARKSVSFDGVTIGKFYTFNSYAATRVYNNAQGKGGNVHINTDKFSLTNGAQVFADTSGKGDAGNIQINAKNFVSVSGTSPISGSSSALFTFTNSTDKGGNIIVDTSAFRALDGGVLNAQTFNNGDGGSVMVRAKLVEVLNGGQLLATSSGNGRAGKITVNATDQVIVNGSNATYVDRVAKFGIKVANDFGTKGVNNINADSGLFVRSESLGSAGNIEVISPQIRLDNSGRFIAESASGNGGDINLQTDLLVLRHGASISTTAGTEKAGGNGGNINIDAPSGFIVAVPSENSDITANAYTGSGGRVDIRAIGIYGIQPRSNPTSLSDITASSEFGVNGTVELNTPDIDPNSGLVNLPTVPVDTQVAQTCQAGGNLAKSSFTITGRGGLPPNPSEALNTDTVQVDLVTLNPNDDNPDRPFVPSKITTPAPKPIIEATALALNKKGEVVLTANLPTITPHSPWLKPASCRAS
ncbi:MAG: filamentous hemagglutinin N-terminal domain-containing protein [Nostoc sp.]|uniref:two-partner secretion domain-containing protein n=1 Tax=Nostoc sp. TaxID=1180 RepID=UPI002FF6A016